MNWSSLASDVQPGVSLNAFTTFRLGGPCSAVITCSSADSLRSVMSKLAAARLDFMLIGGGSNLLVSDTGLDKVVVRYYSESMPVRRDGELLEVEGSMLMDDLARYTVEQGLDGLVFASGIPGTVGGAVVGNAGAFGQQIGDCTESVLLVDRDGSTRWEHANRLGFAYRRSRLQKSDEVVATVHLHLHPGDRDALQKRRDEIMELRRQKHPDWRKLPTAGSFFKNIEPTSAAGRRQAAGWFLEQAGAKEMRVGGARVFEKHANIIVTDPECRARDVYELSQKMAGAVKEHFGLALEREVRLVGSF